jgi:site-specific DNA recombinase
LWGMYSDEGITATNTKHRDGFNQMVEDALAGKIDLIITKSVSRFARNTVNSRKS